MSDIEKNHKHLQEYSLENITPDSVQIYIRSLVPEKEGFIKTVEDFSKEKGYPIIHPEAGTLLSVICKLKQPKNILEIGTCVGYSAFLMCEASIDSIENLVTIERFDTMYNNAEKFISQYNNKDKIKLVKMNAIDFLENIDDKYNDYFDLIFLDGAKAQYINFLPYLKKILKKGGVLFADNILFKGMVANPDLIISRRYKTIYRRLNEFLKEISFSGEFDTTVLPVSDGISISIKK